MSDIPGISGPTIPVAETRIAGLAHTASEPGRARLDGQVLVRIAHEWRSAVAAMSNWLQVLAKPRLDGATHERAVKGLSQSRDFQLELIEQLQDAVLMLNGGLELEAARVDLGSIVRSAVEPLASLAHQRRVELRIAQDSTKGVGRDCDDGPPGNNGSHRNEGGPSALGDARRLGQVLRSVLTAALNLTLPGGFVLVDLERAGDRTNITVRSSQVRVSSESLGLLLDVPHTSSLATTPGHGLGLQLPFARHVIERHGGELHVQPEDNGGAVFTLSLPVTLEHGAQTANEQAVGR